MADDEVKLRITTDASGAITGMRRASDELRRFEGLSGSVTGMIRRHWMSIASAVTVGSLVAMAKSALETMDNVNKMAQKVGMSVESLQAYQYAAKLADVENETLATGLMRLSRNMYEAASGSREMELAFRKLELSVTDSGGQLKTTDRMLEDIAERFSHMSDGTQKTALAMKLFGRSGAELIPFLNQGKEGLKEMREEAEKLGIIFSAEDAARAEAFKDNLTRVEAAFKGIATRAMGDVLPILVSVSDAFMKNIKEGGGLKQTMEGLGEAFRYLVSFGIGVVAAFDIIGTAIAGLAVKAQNFITAAAASKDIILQPGWAMSWSDKTAALKKTWAHGTADIGLGEDLEKKMEAYGSMIESVFDRTGQNMLKRKPGTGGTAGGTGGGNDALSQAIISWRTKIESLDPAVDRFDRQLLALEKDAEKLIQKFGQQQWILDGLARGRYYIEMARDMEETKKVLDALYETERKNIERTTALLMKKADIQHQAERNRIEAQKRIFEEEVRYGAHSGREIAEQQIETETRLLEIERTRLLEVVGIKSVYAETEEQMQEITILGYEILEIEKQLADLAEIRAMRLREYTGSLVEGVETGLKKYRNSLETEFQTGVKIAEEAARGMEQAFSDLFFDAFRGKLESLSDYLKAFLTTVQRSLANVLGQKITGGITKGISALFSGGSSAIPHEMAHAQEHHTGGAVQKYIPAFHNGGLNTDERLVINRVGERYITEEQNAWLNRVAKTAGGGSANVTIVLENGSGVPPLKASELSRKRDSKGEVRRILLELAETDPAVRGILGMKGA